MDVNRKVIHIYKKLDKIMSMIEKKEVKFAKHHTQNTQNW